jgi:alpha-L-rhamnosidase
MVKYEGDLKSDTRYNWTLRVWDNKGNVSKKASSYWHTGITPQEWSAKWIGVASQQPTPIYLRGEGALNKKIRRATAYISAHGIYEAFINGQRVGDKQLTPGWTSYNKHIQYQAFDVTALVRSGANQVAAVVSPVWYSGGITYGRVEKRHYYTRDVALLMQINVEYTDGTKATIVKTDEKWKIAGTNVKAEGITFANIYDGETIDARLRDNSWKTAAVKDGWKAAEALDFDTT